MLLCSLRLFFLTSPESEDIFPVGPVVTSDALLTGQQKDDVDSARLSRMADINRQIQAPVIVTMEDGRYLVCVSSGTCTEFADLWEAEEHLRNLERAGLPNRRWSDSPSW